MRNGFPVLLHFGQNETGDGLVVSVLWEFLDTQLGLFQRLWQLARIQKGHCFALEGLRYLVIHMTP